MQVGTGLTQIIQNYTKLTHDLTRFTTPKTQLDKILHKLYNTYIKGDFTRMANYTITVTSESEYVGPPLYVIYSTSMGPNITMEVGDTLTVTYTKNAGGQSSVTINNWDSSFWNDSSSIVLNNGDSVVRTATAAGVDQLVADFPSSNFPDRNRSVTINAAAATPPDTTLTAIPDVNIGSSDTSFTINIASGGADDVYQVRNRAGTETHESRTGNGSITVTDAPSAGSSKDYSVYAKKPTAAGGDDTYVDVGTEADFTVTRAAASGGGGGSVTHYEYGSGTDITQNVFDDDTIDLYYSVRGEDLNDSWFLSTTSVSASATAGFFYNGLPTGTTFISRLSGFTSTTYSVTFEVNDIDRFTLSGTVTDPYGVTNMTYTTSSGNVPGNGTATIQSNAQTFDTFREGETIDFSVTGGEFYNGSTWATSGTVADGASTRLRAITPDTYSSTNTATVTFSKGGNTKRTESFSVSTQALTAPTDISFALDGDASATEDVTVTASGGSGGTLQVSNDNTNWYANGTKFNHTRGSNVTYYARRAGVNSIVSSSYSESYGVACLAPTNLTFVNDGDASATEQVTVTASGGYGGTLQVSDDGTTWYANGTKFNQSRNSTETYYARRNATNPSATYDEDHTVGYLAPGGYSYSVSATDPLLYSLAFNVTISGADANHTYRVLHGSTSAGTRTTNGDIAITGTELPAAGASKTYTVQALRATSIGGSGVYVTKSTFTRSMRPSTPSVGISPAATESNLTDVTVTASSIGATEYRFSDDGTNYTAWGTSTSHVFEDETRGSSKTYSVQSRSATVDSLIIEAPFTVPYLAPKAFSYTVSDSDPLAYNDTGFNVTISGADTGHTYRVLHSGSSAGTRTTNGNILISGSELPTAGSQKTYTVQVKRSVATGGDDSYDSIYTFTRAMRPSNPTRVTSGFGSEASATASHYISVSSTGATQYRFKVSPADSNSGVFSAWQSSSTFTFDTATYGVTRGDIISTVVEARSSYANAASALTYSSTVSYVNPDLQVAGTSSTIDRGDTTATSTLSAATAGDSYVVRANNGSTNLSNVLTDNGTFTISSGLPAIGSATTYEIFAKRPTNIGGADTYIGSNDTFTVTRYGNPTVDTFATSKASANSGETFTLSGTFTDPQAETISWSLERKTGAGGTYGVISTGTGAMSVNQSIAVASATTYYYRVKISALDSAIITSSEVSVSVSAASATTVDITSVADTTPNENTSDQVEATTTTNAGVSVSSYAWTSTGAITFSSTTAQNPTITFGDVTANAAASVTCTVTDSLGRTVSDTQNYTIQFINQGPLATLSGTQAVLTDEEVNLTALGSYDPDGFALQYQFSTTNGSETFTQAYSSTETFDFTPTETGTYTTTLTVKDTSDATATALFSTIVSEAQDPNAGSGGGYGFEVYNAAGQAVIRSDELIIRKVSTVTLDANGDGSANVALPDTNTQLLVSGESGAETDDGIDYSVSVVNSTATVSIAAPGFTRVDLYMIK